MMILPFPCRPCAFASLVRSRVRCIAHIGSDGEAVDGLDIRRNPAKRVRHVNLQPPLFSLHAGAVEDTVSDDALRYE